jgi:vacuolar-type H+-ATPase subunit E/Vma4
MPLYDQVELLCQAILAQGREEAEKIAKQARSQAQRLTAAEENRHREALARAQREVQARAHHEARNLMDRSALENKRRVAEAKEAVMACVFELGRERLLAFRDSPEYRDWFKQMLRKALGELTGDSFRLLVHPEETARLGSDLIDEVSRETGSRLEVAPTEQVSPGGFMALTADGRLRYDATFQGLMDRRRDSLRTEIAQMLWQT